ncbi:MAG: GGDEF domain-containing protein [Cetobacterium sp.]|uniref:GGDEF domain-containing protein n=1 Tax=Cetobacterium sp. TaxID=2071632 RepID=UPI003F34BFFB
MKIYIRMLNILFVLVLAFSIFSKRNFLYSEIETSIEHLNSHIDENIYILKNEMNFLYKTRKKLPIPEYKTEGFIKYFKVGEAGVFYDRVDVMPENYYLYNLKDAKITLNKKFNNSLLSIAYNKVKPVYVEQFENGEAAVFKGDGDTIFIDSYHHDWVEKFQKKTISKSFFKKAKSITRDEIEFVLYDLYIDEVYKTKMFTIIIPEYRLKDDIETLRGIWYFDFDEKIFSKELRHFKLKNNLEIGIIDSKNNLIAATKYFKYNKNNKKFYVFQLQKTNYKILVQKIGFFNVLDLGEIIFIVVLVLLRTYLFKKDRLQNEIQKLKEIQKIKSYTLVRDPLTNLYNRHFIENIFTLPLQSCAVIIFDIDYFKKINDSLGHDKGDLVLKGVSSVLKLICSKKDHVIRWGGEEFLIIINYIDSENLGQKLKLLQNMIKKLNLIDNYIITASYGAVIRDIKNKEELYKAILESDKKMYIAKQTGRDKIEM